MLFIHRPTARAELRLEFFGGPSLWREDTPVRISPFQAGLLSLAFGTGRVRVPRSTVQALLWNKEGGRAVRHRLSQLVYQTNHRCRARVIELAGEHVLANEQVVATDLGELKEAVRNSDFKTACDILERGFLPAFPNRRTDAFSDWMEKQELAIRAHLRNRALADWNASEAVHDWAAARSSAEALSRLDPHDEAALRRVIRAHAMGGRVEEAEAEYRSFSERADSSGRWAPQRATRSLLKSVKSVRKRPDGKSRITRTHDPDVPLTGRANELSRLGRSISHPRSQGSWCIVTLTGDQGLGKTRLIEEAMQGARFRGYQVMYACPGEFERDIPLSPLLEALDAAWAGPMLQSVPDPWRAHLLSLLPQLDPERKTPARVPGDRPERLQRHTCEALLHLFTTITRSRPAIVVLDNFHWVDEATATVVQFLHKRWRDGDLTLLLAYRQDKLDRNEIAARLVEELEADATVIRLDELERSAAREIVVLLSGEKLAEATIEGIVTMADGNPRYLIEITADALASGSSSPQIQVPASLRQRIARGIGELAPKARSIMSALAVFGHPTTVRCLTEITGHSRHDCIDALDTLLARRLVERRDEKVRIRQDIVRQAVYEGLSPTRRSLLHSLTAEVLRSSTRSLRPDRIAEHYHRAGERQLACAYALEATRPSVELDPRKRSRFVQIAYETSEGRRRERLTLPLARALHRSGQFADALRYAGKALRQIPTLTPAESSAARLIVSETRALLGRESTPTTLDRLAHQEQAALANNMEVVFAEVLDARLRLLVRTGDRDGIAHLFARMNRLEGLRDPVANCRVLATLAMQAEYGHPAEGLVCARRAVSIARGHDLHSETMLARQRHIAALAVNGLLATKEGRTSVAEAGTAVQRSDDLVSHLLILLELAKWHTTTGGLDKAADLLENVHAERTDCPEIRYLTILARAKLALVRGDLPTAVATLATVRSSADSGPEETLLLEGGTRTELHGEVIWHARVPPYLNGALAGVEGNILLESGKLHQAATIAGSCIVEEPLRHASIDLVLFHARLLSRKGDVPEALDLLMRVAEAHGAERPLHWLRATLDLVRLARRTGSPRPDLASRAHELAHRLDLPGLAHEFVPFR